MDQAVVVHGVFVEHLVHEAGVLVRSSVPDVVVLVEVDSIASRWSTRREGERNVTWFEIDLPEPGD